MSHQIRPPYYTKVIDEFNYPKDSNDFANALSEAQGLGWEVFHMELTSDGLFRAIIQLPERGNVQVSEETAQTIIDL